jgi:hypothetical protein
MECVTTNNDEGERRLKTAPATTTDTEASGAAEAELLQRALAYFEALDELGPDVWS